jgi:hypothetical protein
VDSGIFGMLKSRQAYSQLTIHNFKLLTSFQLALFNLITQ